MLMTSNVECAHNVHAVSGSLLSAPTVFGAEMHKEQEEKMLPLRSHVLISLATHTEAIKTQIF